MLSIYKYPIDANTDTLSLPRGAKILDVQTQLGRPCLWALVDIESTDFENRHFRTYGIGHHLEGDAGDYVATFQLGNGLLVFHVFEVSDDIPKHFEENKVMTLPVALPVALRVAEIKIWMETNEYRYHSVREIRSGIDRYHTKDALRHGLRTGLFNRYKSMNKMNNEGKYLYGLRVVAHGTAAEGVGRDQVLMEGLE